MSAARIDLEACWQGAHEYPGFPLPQEALRAFVRLARAARAYAAPPFSWEKFEEFERAMQAFTDSAEKP